MPLLLHKLGSSYLARFERLGEMADIEKVIAHRTRAASLISDGHCKAKPNALNNLGLSHRSRFIRLVSQLADIEKAIDCQSQAIELARENHEEMSGFLNNIANSLVCRFRFLGQLHDIDKSIAYYAQAIYLTPQGHFPSLHVSLI
jgi:tetratricopeptide (TPR) repeat protein